MLQPDPQPGGGGSSGSLANQSSDSLASEEGGSPASASTASSVPLRGNRPSSSAFPAQTGGRVTPTQPGNGAVDNPPPVQARAAARRPSAGAPAAAVMAEVVYDEEDPEDGQLPRAAPVAAAVRVRTVCLCWGSGGWLVLLVSVCAREREHCVGC